MNKKAIALAMTMLMGASVLSGCGGSKDAATSELDKIQAAGKLVVGTEATWAPFEYVGADGAVVGSDMDLAKHIADALGVELEIVNASFDSLPTLLANGDVDILASALTITDERKEAMEFSVPYTISEQYIIVPQDNMTVATVEDLAGMRIGSQLGTTGDFLIADAIDLDDGVLHNSGASYQQYKYPTDGIEDMKGGNLDAFVCDILPAQNLCALNPEIKCMELAYKDGSTTKEEYGIGVKKGETDFVNKINEIIQPLIDDGTVETEIETHREATAETAE